MTTGSNRRTLPPSPFVGRAHEMQRLDRACRAALQGRGSLVVVSGEAGIGKTRLGEEAAVHASRLGLRSVAVRCWVEGGAQALWPWQPVLAELCGPEAADLLTAKAGRATLDPERFVRFVACTEQLAVATGTAPACLIIDDIQAADAGTLLLTRFVARSVAQLHLVLILNRRTGATLDPEACRLLDAIEREATSLLALRGFDVAETSAFLTAHGFGPCDEDAARVLHRLSGGSPLYLRRTAALGGPDPARAEAHGLQAAVDEALDGLGTEARQVLARAAVLGPVISLSDAAVVAGAGSEVVRAAVDEAVAAGLATLESVDHFSFTHDLVRAALEARTPPARRWDSHAAAATLLSGPDYSSQTHVRAAHHLLQAALRSPDDARRSVDACRAAARSLVGNFAYEQADEMLTAAVDLHSPATIGPPSGALLVEWAETALLCGRLADARRRFNQAAAGAEQEGDPRAFADAALGMGGIWVDERRSPVERAHVLGQQRAALAALPPSEVARRCRLQARLTAEAAYDGASLDPVLHALDQARQSGDARARAEALSLCHHCMLGPEHAYNRLDLADELITVASEAGLGVLSLMGLCWRAVDLFLLGHPGAARALADLREHADALATQNVLYVVEALDVMLLIRAGRLEEAEAAAVGCHERGTEVGDIDAFGYLGAHMLAIRWIQGRDAELTELADQVATSPTLVPAEFAFRAAAAAVAARAGRHARAQAGLDRLAIDGLAALPRSSTWLIGMTAIVEAATELGDTKVAGQTYDLLLPYAELPVMPSLAVACLGSAQRALGVAAAAQRDLTRAIEHFEQAMTANARLENRPMVAICQAELAHALAQRGTPEDLTRADELWRTAVSEARRMGMTGRLDEWEQRQQDTAAGRARAPYDPPGVIHREGAGWIVGIGDHLVPVPDLVGMRYLAELLTHPGEPIPALSLAAGGQTAPADLSRQQLLDQEARAAYLARGRDLAERLATAEAHHDLERVSALESELDALVDHLEAATGAAGRSRTFGGPAERARTAVRKAIKRAIDHIDTADPSLACVLRATVSTGFTCLYTSDRRQPIRWTTSPRASAISPADPSSAEPRIPTHHGGGGDRASKS